MTGPEKPAVPGKGKPGKDPFGPPLEEAHVRELFRRLAARPATEQQAFVTRVNWNLLDATSERYLIAWLATALFGGSRDFALAVLDRLPHPKRARHVERFQALLPRLAPDVAEKLQNAFGPVLGGLPKSPRVKKPGAKTPGKPAVQPTGSAQPQPGGPRRPVPRGRGP